MLFIGLATGSYWPYNSPFPSLPVHIIKLFYPAEAMNWWTLGQIQPTSCFVWPTEYLLEIMAQTFKNGRLHIHIKISGLS